ncbi:MAG: hypothetical protein J6Y78_16075 [Paludibacteraceae bacterium]|nr:hypothetical protein [Paludibacteraceae bacterium]
MAWHVVTSGAPNKSNYMEFLLDNASDISTPPTMYNYGPSSIAHTPGFAEMWESDAQGNWIEVGGGS